MKEGKAFVAKQASGGQVPTSVRHVKLACADTGDQPQHVDLNRNRLLAGARNTARFVLASIAHSAGSLGVHGNHPGRRDRRIQQATEPVRAVYHVACGVTCRMRCTMLHATRLRSAQGKQQRAQHLS